MKKVIISILIFGILLFCFWNGVIILHRYYFGARITKGIEVYFSPKGGCESKIIEYIGEERGELYVSAYSFTNREIGEALVRKGRRVHVIVDRSETSKELVRYLKGRGIDVVMDRRHPIAHNKVMVGSGWVETGSYNYTNQAEDHNAENCIFIRDKVIADKYRENWKRHREHTVEAIYE